MNRFLFLPLALASCVFLSTSPAQQPKAYRLPGVDLKPQIIWGAVCDGPDGTGLAFGGQDQKSDDGIGHTRIKVNGEWVAIHEELRKSNPLQEYHDRLAQFAKQHKELQARTRHAYFQGKERTDLPGALVIQREKLADDWLRFLIDHRKATEKHPEKTYEARQLRALDAKLHAAGIIGWCGNALREMLKGTASLKGDPATAYGARGNCSSWFESLADLFGAEPPPRALSPIVYDPKTKHYVLFGGDHLDYLMNDTWHFDPAKKKWLHQRIINSPPPRANHTLKAMGDGTVVLSGGYTYTSTTDYVGGQYRDLNDGDWTYDVALGTWTGTGKAVEANQRVYRTGPFHPDFYLEGAKPQAKEVSAKRQAMVANTWVAMNPPKLPRLNRDWGTAVLDPDRDLILRWSGGHSAHGGTDVLHYHLATNRWELTFPVEFPLGQTYSNTEYPEGFNFNRRPWVTGHTYQNYGYDIPSKTMLFTGRHDYCYFYDPEIGDWTGRIPKPKGMVYNSCFYTLTCCGTPKGLVCWTAQGGFFRYDAAKKEWQQQTIQGKLPGAVVDNSTVVYDTKRDRFLFAVKGYGAKNKYDGQLHVLDGKTWTVSTLSPKGMEAAAAIPYLCQIRYDEANDLLLVGGLLPPDESGFRRTPAYDCAANQWVSLKIGGSDPNGKTGRNVSLGLMYDAKRQLFWAVDTNSQVYVLGLDPKTADVQPLR